MLNKKEQIRMLIKIDSLLNAGYDKTINMRYFYRHKQNVDYFKSFEQRLKRLAEFLLKEPEDYLYQSNDLPSRSFSLPNFKNFFQDSTKCRTEQLLDNLETYTKNKNLTHLVRFCVAFYILQRYSAISYEDKFVRDVSEVVSIDENSLAIEIDYNLIINKALFKILKIGLENIPEFIHAFKVMNLSCPNFTFNNHMFSSLPKTITDVTIGIYYSTYKHHQFKIILQQLPTSIKSLYIVPTAHLFFYFPGDPTIDRIGDSLLDHFNAMPKNITFLTLSVEKIFCLLMSGRKSGCFPNQIQGLGIIIDFCEEKTFELLTEIFNFLPGTINYLQLRFDAKVALKDQDIFISSVKNIPSHVYTFEVIMNKKYKQEISIEKINEEIADRINQNLKTRMLSLKDLALNYICGQKSFFIDENSKASFTTPGKRIFAKIIPTSIADEIKGRIPDKKSGIKY